VTWFASSLSPDRDSPSAPADRVEGKKREEQASAFSNLLGAVLVRRKKKKEKKKGRAHVSRLLLLGQGETLAR